MRCASPAASLRSSTHETFRPINDRNLELPTFSGAENPEAFFGRFELLCQLLGCDEERRKGYLVAKLRAAASALIEGHGAVALTWSYDALKSVLLSHFTGESKTHARKL